MDVAMSDQFLGWVFSLGDGIRIVSPQEAVDRYMHDLDAIKALY